LSRIIRFRVCQVNLHSNPPQNLTLPILIPSSSPSPPGNPILSQMGLVIGYIFLCEVWFSPFFLPNRRHPFQLHLEQKVNLHNTRDCCTSISLIGFVKKKFDCGYVSFIVKSLSFIVLRLKTKPRFETDT
jgi:hypothetical protein